LVYRLENGEQSIVFFQTTACHSWEFFVDFQVANHRLCQQTDLNFLRISKEKVIVLNAEGTKIDADIGKKSSDGIENPVSKQTKTPMGLPRIDVKFRTESSASPREF
jgi:hypothetical protein